MPVRKFNYTGRVRIMREHAAVTVHSSPDAFWFSADINLEEYRLPEDALVFVEAYPRRQTAQRARFAFGTVGELHPPEIGMQLDIASKEDVLFRLKVVEPEKGKILAHADRISPKGEGISQSLLAVQLHDFNDEQCWQVYFGREPELRINRRIYPHWRAVAESPVFRALVYPAVLREILTHILRDVGHYETDGDDWCDLWLRLAADNFQAGEPPMPEIGEHSPSGEEIDQWIDKAVAGYTRRVKALRAYNDYAENES